MLLGPSQKNALERDFLIFALFHEKSKRMKRTMEDEEAGNSPRALTPQMSHMGSEKSCKEVTRDACKQITTANNCLSGLVTTPR